MTPVADLDTIREECRQRVRKRALMSAGAAVVPVPFLDVMVDAHILMELLPEISRRFGLDAAGMARMDTEHKATAWRTIRQRGSQLIGIVITRQVVRKSFLGFAGRVAAMQLAKFVPLGGQLVAAGLGYFVMREMAYQHIDDCYAVAQAVARA